MPWGLSRLSSEHSSARRDWISILLYIRGPVACGRDCCYPHLLAHQRSTLPESVVLLGSGMVNFKSPVVAAQDFGAYAFSSGI